MRSFGYDDLGRTASDTLTGPGGTLRSQTYTYDPNDNPLTTVIGPSGAAGAGNQSYGYDRADRLASWTNQAGATTTYGWDAAGNRTSVNTATATYDERNRLLSDGTATYSYTARGTLSSRVAGSTTSTTLFDAFDRLASDTTGGATTTFEYDGLNRLAVRNSSQRFVYDGLDREPAIDGTSAYARDPDGDLIGTGTQAGNWATLTDIHGDLVGAFTTDGAGLTDSRAYDPFGVPTTAGYANLRIGYQGSWTDPATGKVDAQARWYTPGTGGFASRDSAGLALTSSVSTNRYLYAGANPLANNDLTGQSLKSVLSSAALVVGVEALGGGLDATGVGLPLGIAVGAAGGYLAGRAANHYTGSQSHPQPQAQTGSGTTTGTKTGVQTKVASTTVAPTVRSLIPPAPARPVPARPAAAPRTVSAPAATPPGPAATPPIHGTFYNGYSAAALPPAVRSQTPQPISSGPIPLVTGNEAATDQTAGRQYIATVCGPPLRCIGDTPTPALTTTRGTDLPAAGDTPGDLSPGPTIPTCAAGPGVPLADTCLPGVAAATGAAAGDASNRISGELAGHTGTPGCEPDDEDCLEHFQSSVF